MLRGEPFECSEGVNAHVFQPFPKFFRFSPRLFGLISKHFPPLSKGSFEPLLEDSAPHPEAFLPHFEDLPAFFQDFFELPLKNFRASFRSFTASFLSSFEPPSKGFSKFFPKSCSLFSSLFSHFPKASQASFQKLHKPLSKDSQAPFKSLTSPFLKICNLFPKAFGPFYQRLPALLRASRSLFLAFSPYSLRRRGRFCGSGSGPRRSGRRRCVRSMLCCNCHSFILASWPESRMSGTFQPL